MGILNVRSSTRWGMIPCILASYNASWTCFKFYWKAKQPDPVSRHPIIVGNTPSGVCGGRRGRRESETAHDHKLTCGSNTVTIKVDPSRTPTVANSSNRSFFPPDADDDDVGATVIRTGARSCGVTRPLARASSCATSRRSRSTQAAILASARANSSRAVGSVSACCEPGVRDAVAIGPRFEELEPYARQAGRDVVRSGSGDGWVIFGRRRLRRRRVDIVRVLPGLTSHSHLPYVATSPSPQNNEYDMFVYMTHHCLKPLPSHPSGLVFPFLSAVHGCPCPSCLVLDCTVMVTCSSLSLSLSP